MSGRELFTACTLMVLLSSSTSAATLDEVANRDDQKKLEKMRDLCVGEVSDAVLQKICRALNKPVSSKPKRSNALASSKIPHSGPDPASGVKAAGPAADAPDNPCDKRLFIRADPLDNYHYAVAFGADTAKGATVSYTDDRISSKQSASINALISYVLVAEACTKVDDPTRPFIGFAVAPWFAANGNWDKPFNKKTDLSALKTGADFQLHVSTTQWELKDQYFAISPYVQTDFQDIARVSGANFSWEPVIPKLRLGFGANNYYYGWFWQFRGEADVRNVSNPGMTGLVKGNYEWLGETARINLALFPLNPPGSPWSTWLYKRFSLIGTQQYYWDANSGQEVRFYSVTLQYKLSPCKKDKPDPTNPDPYPDCSIQGSSSLSFEYDHGTDKDTMIKANKYLVKLGYSY